AGTTGTLTALGDRDDAWWVNMGAGVTYRVNVVPAQGLCLSVLLYGPNVSSFGDDYVREKECGGYFLFTPGADGSGKYSIVIGADEEADVGVLQAYRLQVAPAGPDDTAPGIFLQNRQRVTGRVGGLGVDVTDLYRFDVARRGALTLGLRDRPRSQFDLVVLREDGGTVECACGHTGPVQVRRQIAPGSYYALVRARGHGGGAYRLSL